MRLTLGLPVRCSDAPFGELADVVIDPGARRVTHLVVEPRHQHWLARLVPIDLATADEAAGELVLACTVEHVRGFESVQEVAEMRLAGPTPADPDRTVGVQDVLALPPSPITGFGWEELDDARPATVTYDLIPRGDVELRRTSPVFSSDGHHLGHVDGLGVDADARIRELVLERGRLWRRRRIAIPNSAVARVETDVVTLDLTRHEVDALPVTG